MKKPNVKQALYQYPYVLLLDDSCFISRHCPDIFNARKGNGLAAVQDAGLLALRGGRTHVVNTGVLVYGKQQLAFLDNVESRFSGLQGSGDQALINAAVKSGSLKIEWLSWRFNVVGSQLNRLDKLEAKPWIYHLTSAMPLQKRARWACDFKDNDA